MLMDGEQSNGDDKEEEKEEKGEEEEQAEEEEEDNDEDVDYDEESFYLYKHWMESDIPCFPEDYKRKNPTLQRCVALLAVDPNFQVYKKLPPK